MNDFGQFVRKLRESKNMSVTSVAEQVGINHSHLSRVESGDRNPPKIPTLVKLAKVLDVPISRMLKKAGVVEDVGIDEASRLAEYYISEEDLNDSILKIIKEFTNDEGFFPEKYHEEIFHIFKSNVSFTDEEKDFERFYEQYLNTEKEDISSSDEEHAVDGFNTMFNYLSIKRSLKHLGTRTKELLLEHVEGMAKKHLTPYLVEKSGPPPMVNETGMNFYGGSEKYTQDEIEVMEAALKAYREQKKKLMEQLNKDQ
ncbi:XRE family transcriptional regulator [Paenibacillus dendritiformis]|uniref:helix-turn-helix domain-containing protein n=1 Tax=Paenibacillus dendritiformis TaxID=130049 RepID=UPI0010592653|nr:helix-turn-helix transcriptional regulator [Paenibacillus dendritiformis]TDL50930.1 XRE family transcriptional regulator [Paenibacillus dendritiformis]